MVTVYVMAKLMTHDKFELITGKGFEQAGGEHDVKPIVFRLKAHGVVDWAGIDIELKLQTHFQLGTAKAVDISFWLNLKTCP